ncbi:hypothetical protein AK40_5969 (plasmid) [Bacillus cereus 03BB108]|uniref:Uncharacterized protein n=1 Tax=Bacillus cereus 03BB108 TaxID=451709 RepID=A0AAN0W4H5_BACCE|nr:hypothetical protein AK40_5969 [Bacillus cereus 03BB108]
MIDKFTNNFRNAILVRGALFCCLALFVANDVNKYLKSLLFSMFMTVLVIKMGGY